MQYKHKYLFFLMLVCVPLSQARPLKIENENHYICKVIESNNSSILVKTGGQYTWNKVIDCVKKQEGSGNEYIRNYSITPTLTTRKPARSVFNNIRQSRKRTGAI